MVRRRKPTIIKLHPYSDAGLKTDVKPSINPGTQFRTSVKNLCSNKEDSSLTMPEEFDEVLTNNFRWLVDFDLNSISLFDIDGDPYLAVNGEANNCDRSHQFGSRCRVSSKNDSLLHSNVIRQRKPKRCEQPTYSQNVVECLREYEGETTVQMIYKWMSERFPELKHSNNSWKSTIRHTLAVSPLFYKRKAKSGKRYVWCLKKSENIRRTDNSSCYIQETNHGQNGNEHQQVTTCSSFGTVHEKSSVKAVTTEQPLPAVSEDAKHECFYSAYDSDSSVHLPQFIAGNECQPSLKGKAGDYYDLEAAAATEFLTEAVKYEEEQIEVEYFFEEHEIQIPLEMI